MEEFYDYLRFAISMSQLKLPVLVMDNIKKDISDYIDRMNEDELTKVDYLISTYQDYYNEEENNFKMLDERLHNSQDSEVIFHIFANELGSLYVKEERLAFINDFLESIRNLINDKRDRLNLSENRG